jgi:hypothetical protein
MEVGVSLDGVNGTAEFDFFATHLTAGANDANRWAQAAYINSLVAGSSTPAVLAGDFNATPSSRVIERIGAEWHDPTDLPNPGLTRSSQIDYVFYRHAAQWNVVSESRFIINATTQAASDHYPILAVLEYVAPTADFDGDADVDGADLLAWQRGLGPAARAGGDANGDGAASAADLAVWQSQFGRPAAAAAPEPTTLALLALAAAALVFQRVRFRAPRSFFRAPPSALLPFPLTS